MDLKLTTRTRDDGIAVVAVSGCLDVYTAGALRGWFAQAEYDGCQRIVADLSGCEYVDSTGLVVLVGGLKRCRAHDGQLALAGASGNVLRDLRITGLVKVFAIRDTVDEAAEALLAACRG